ncbi:MAG: hypothetical protein Q7S02_05460 [bacterium]|nr:hypothetical protein [bacterium]
MEQQIPQTILTPPSRNLLRRVLVWVVIAALAGTAYVLIRRYVERADSGIVQGQDLARCERKGGKVVQHAFGATCEMRARDGGKACTYDGECTKRSCVYADANAQMGACDDYTTDNDGRPICHRARRAERVSCGMDIS